MMGAGGRKTWSRQSCNWVSRSAIFCAGGLVAPVKVSGFERKEVRRMVLFNTRSFVASVVLKYTLIMSYFSFFVPAFLPFPSFLFSRLNKIQRWK